MNLLNLKPEAFGLDISDLSLKVVKLKRKGKFLRLASFGEAKIEQGIIEEGEIKDEGKLAEVIKEAIKKVKGDQLKTKYVIVSLPEEKSFLQVIQMPKMSEEDLKSAVIYEAENYIPLPLEQVYLDSQIIPPVLNHLDHFDVLIVAFPKRIVDSYVRCLKKAGLQPKALEIESLAIARSLIKDEETNCPVLLIDLGAARTSLAVFSGHSLRFTSSISLSSKHFTEIISKNFNISLQEAERLKVEYGLEKKVRLRPGKEGFERVVEKGEIFEALVPALVDLIQQIQKYLDYYRTHAFHEHLSSSNEISKILLCGGGANLAGLTELLSMELKVPVELGNPWVNIPIKDKKEISEFSLEKSLRYATALGLALRGIKENGD